MKEPDTTRVRRKIVEWQDPLIGVKAARAWTGLEYLHAMKTGAVPAPPITQLVGFALESFETDRTVFSFTPSEDHYNPMGTVHGGILTTVIDSAMGCAVQTRLPAGRYYTTLEFKVNFVRPVTVATGPMLVEGRVVHFGTKTATAEGFLRDAEGRLCAHGTTTCLHWVPESA